MTKEQLQALLDYIDARIDEKIESAFGRDGLSEMLKADQLVIELRKEMFDASRF